MQRSDTFQFDFLAAVERFYQVFGIFSNLVFCHVLINILMPGDVIDQQTIIIPKQLIKYNDQGCFLPDNKSAKIGNDDPEVGIQ